MKPQAVDPGATSRAEAFALWMDAPNPMVTFFKTLDVTPLVRLSRWKGLKFNMLLCWCIGSAASRVKEFYLLPVGKELLRYDTLAVNTIVKKPARRGQLLRRSLQRRPRALQFRLSAPHKAGHRKLREPRPDGEHGDRHLGHYRHGA